MTRLYADTSHSYSILRGAVLQGLGGGTILQQWPKGRSYYDVGYFRSPYKRGFYQDGSLLGLGAPPADITASIDQSAPPNVKRYLLSGEPVSPLANNVALPFNQVSRLAYGLISAGALGLCYFSYKRFKKANP